MFTLADNAIGYVFNFGDGGTKITSLNVITNKFKTLVLKHIPLPSLPFNQDFFIILNVAMGGNFGGPVDASINSATMEIDYLRLYQ